VDGNPLRFLKNRVLPLSGSLRVAMEPFIKKGGGGSESVFDFAKRRIGKTAAALLVDAMVSGVFAGNSQKLELKSAFPKMRAMEKQYGSLVKAMIAARKAGRKGGGPAGPAGRLTSFTNGMSTLIEALESRLGSVLKTGNGVKSIIKHDGGFTVMLAGGESVETEQVVLAVPAYEASKIVKTMDPELGDALDQIYYPPVTVAAAGYREEDLEYIPEGFGFLVPRGQGVHSLGTLWASSLWKDRTPARHVLMRIMAGGACNPDDALLNDDLLLSLVLKDLEITMGYTAAPVFYKTFRFNKAIAQYEPGHYELLLLIEKMLKKNRGLHLSGSAYRGISINHCIEDAHNTAQKLLS
jgi:oxygen-dependent protoporphyrinogen oxidase